MISEQEDLSNYKTWKIHLWGNRRDSNLIHYLEMNQRLDCFSSKDLSGDGYKQGNKKKNAEWLRKYKTFPHGQLKRYGDIDYTLRYKSPSKVETRGKEETYKGLRLLFKEGVEQKTNPKGHVIICLEDEDFAFTDSVFGLKLSEEKVWLYKCILGICWSSVARYYWFMSSSNWGVWRDKLLSGQVFSLPVKIPEKVSLKNRIIQIVDKLQAYDPVVKVDDMFQKGGVPLEEIETKRRGLELQLDDAIFELYGLGEAEIDLIRDMCQTNLEYYYSPDKSTACQPILSAPLKKNYGTVKQLPKGIGGYLGTFIKSWSPYLDENTQLHWCLHLPPKTDSMIAVVFSIRTKAAKPGNAQADDKDSWDSVLERMDSSLTHHFGSQRIYIEGLVRAVTEEEILIIKRNENRLWTRSMAREDVEATLVLAMNRKSAGEIDVCK